MTIKKRFNAGDGLLTKVTASYLNSIESRLNVIENIKGSAPVDVYRSLNGIAISLSQHIDKFQFGQLTAELDEDGEQTANLIGRDSTQAAGSQWTENIQQQVTVNDPVGTRIPDNSIGLIFDHFKADTKTKIFWPFPIRLFYIQADVNVASASTFACSLLDLAGVDTTDTITAQNPAGLWDEVLSGAKGLAIKVAEEYHPIFFDTSNNYTFDISGDTGSQVTVESGDLVNLDGATGTFTTRAESERGIMVNTSKGGTTINADIAVNESVLQWILLSGTALTPGSATTLPIEDSTADANGGNFLTFIASAGESPVELTGTEGTDASIEFGANNPFHTISGDTGSDQDLEFQDTLNIVGDGGDISVAISRSAPVTTATISSSFAQMTFEAGADINADETIADADVLQLIGGSALAVSGTSLIKTTITEAANVISIAIEGDISICTDISLVGAQATGDAAVRIEQGTANTLIISQSSGDGIAVAGDDTTGSLTFTISPTDTLFSITDGVTTEAILFTNTITYAGGNGILSTGIVSATNTVTFAVDDTVAQQVVLTANGGTVAGSPVTILVSAGTDNSIGINAGTNVTFVDEGDGTFTISSDDAVLSDPLWSVITDDTTVRGIDHEDEVDFEGDGTSWDAGKTTSRLGIRTRGVVISSTLTDVQFQINDTPLQEFSLAGAQSTGDLTVEVESGTNNSILLTQSAGDGIAIDGDDTTGSLTYSISPTDALFIISDGSATQEIVFTDTILYVGGNGLDAVVSATDTVTFAIDDTVAQHLQLEESGGTVLPINPTTINITDHASANSIGLLAGTNITLDGNTAGKVKISSSGGGSDWEARADSGADQTVDDTTTAVDFAGGTSAAASARAIFTTVSEAANVVTVQIDVGENVALERRITAKDVTNHDGQISGDTTVPVEEGTVNANDWQASYGIKLNTAANSGITEINSENLWGIAQANSADVDPSATTFLIKLCDNQAGANPNAATDICHVYAGSNGDTGNNIRSGEVIPVLRCPDTDAFMTFTGADDPIGHVKIKNITSTLRPGWIALAAIVGRFPRSAATAGGTGGIDSVTPAGTNATNTTGVIAALDDHADHTDHAHTVSGSPHDINANPTIVNVADELTHCTSGVKTISSCAAPGAGVLGHSAHAGTEIGHTHAFTGNAHENRPAFYELIYIVRTT